MAQEIQGSARMLQLTMLANKNIASCHFPQPPQTLRIAARLVSSVTGHILWPRLADHSIA